PDLSRNGAAPGPPRGRDAPAGRDAHPDGDAARRAPQRLGDRLLRPPRRRDPPRGKRGRARTSRGVLARPAAPAAFGHRGDEILTEESGRGRGYLAEVAGEGEAATAVAIARGVR